MRVKILISDGSEENSGSSPIKVAIVGGEPENIDVHVNTATLSEQLQQKPKEAEQPTPTPPSPPKPNTRSPLPKTRHHLAARIFLFLHRPVKPPKTPHTLPQTSAEAPTNEPRTIEIKITIPRPPEWFTRAELKQRLSHVSKKAYIAAGVVAIVVVALLASIPFTKSSPTKPPTTKIAGALSKSSPKFATLLPSDKSITALGGWTLISPPNRSPVYTYVDKVDTVQINVSEQQLPESLREDTSQRIEELAKGFNATEKITAAGTTVYIGKSAKGPQSVIFAKDNLLILIKSTRELSNDQWTAYVSSLR